MTNQVLAQLEFFEQNLEKKEKRLVYNKKYFGRLPGFRWTIRRQEKGIQKVKADIIDMNSRIQKLEKEGKIFSIL